LIAIHFVSVLAHITPTARLRLAIAPMPEMLMKAACRLLWISLTKLYKIASRVLPSATIPPPDLSTICSFPFSPLLS
jgi:hypothetical protein